MNNIYIKMNFSFEKLLKLYLYFYFIADSMFFYVFSYSTNDSIPLRTLLALITLAILFYFGIKKQTYGTKFKRYGFVNGYIFFAVVVMVIQYAYSSIQYSQTLLDVFMMGQCYFSLIMIPIYLFLFEDDPEECDRMLKWVAIIGIVNTLILLFGAVCLDSGISVSFPKISIIGRRNNHIRVSYRTVGFFSFFYCFGEFLRNGLRKSKLIVLYLIAFMIGVFVFVNTRAITIAIVVSVFVVILLYSENKNIKILMTLGLIAVVAYALLSGTFSSFFDSFSIESEEASSTIARLNAIEYFRTFTDRNPFLGMGIIRPYTDELRLIWSGPFGTAYFDDLGLLGGFYRMGILGLSVMVIPLLRMSYLAYKLWRYKAKEAYVFIGVVVYILASQTAQNYLDFQRAVIASFYWATMEYLYYKNKEAVENENNNYSLSLEQQR